MMYVRQVVRRRPSFWPNMSELAVRKAKPYSFGRSTLAVCYLAILHNITAVGVQRCQLSSGREGENMNK